MKYTFHLSTGATIIVDVDGPVPLSDGKPALGPWLVDKNGTAVLMGAVIAMVPAEEPAPEDALPDKITDGEGDVWTRHPGTDRYSLTGRGDIGWTREEILATYPPPKSAPQN